MKINVSNSIRVQNATPDVLKWCKENLVLDNPDYYKKVQMGKWVGNIPSEIALFEKEGDDLIIPFGCLKDIYTMFKDVPWNVIFCPLRAVEYKSGINLYPYQSEAVKMALKTKNGILVMPCGSGKTQCGLEIISRIGGRALWLTHTQDLLNQSKARAESVLDCPKGAFGTITAGKVNIGTHITFATVQTMCKLDLSRYQNSFDVIVVDECQHCAGSPTRVTQFYKVVSSLAARYKIGLTATPKRADGLEQAMFAILGPVIHEVSRKEVEGTTCPVMVERIETGWMPDFDCVLMGDGTIDYSKVIDNMTHDENRYNFLLERIMKINIHHEPMIILANRVEYLQKMCDDLNRFNFKSVCISGAGNSKKAKAERKAALEQLNNGSLDVLLATYQLAKEGLDVPNLRYVVFATPEKDETTVTQAVGRVGRKADGKAFGTVIDFVDAFGMYQGFAKKRIGYYNKIKAEVLDETLWRHHED